DRVGRSSAPNPSVRDPGEEVKMAKNSGSSSKGSARSAITGKYVTKGYAKSHPKTTVVESKKK
ncbi:MAG: hypothetical protein L0H03_25245, partial [Rhodococcus sp. (in: high G+C Gram-positive bacteria)]|nr:hypothetical protein [Rhodococcus sp. (in: high G+C Gram-positive bacteria)]